MKWQLSSEIVDFGESSPLNAIQKGFTFHLTC